MDQTIRNKLRGVVTRCRKLLEDSTAQALQGRFGIYAARKKGEVQIEDEARMAHLTEEDRACRQDLLDHLEHIQAIGYKPSEALEQLVREIAFTHLNRLCAYKMMESRGLIREAVSRGLKSQGFFFYLSDHLEDEKLHNGGGQETAYRNFLDWLGGTLSQEIGVLFNPNDPANRIYPPQRVLDEVLALINDEELKDIWSQDETIGWVYQYFTPKELRDKARKESQAPRNSYELAFRNQFFTPRYVVEFLTDNTLGRIWYEMRKGKTVLKDSCLYLVRRPIEIFLKEGEEPPAEAKDAHEKLSQEELLKQPVYIPHRPKKDPRKIKVLDPAGGSGHFLLYCFDLLQVIYEEAYDDPDLGAVLRRDYPAIEDLRRAVPGLILKHNLHGIDIDLRATQIAALALWLRCQRAYQEMGLKNGDRPKITRSNLVCAEPMPGEEDIRQEFVQGLDDKLGQLVSFIFERMKLAGEAGSLLKIEGDIGGAIREIYGQYGEMFREVDEQQWVKAEEDLLKALRVYTVRAENGRGFRLRLFAEDASRGFSFVDVCRKKYDVVLMNPPFGEFIKGNKALAKESFPNSYNDIFAAFTERWFDRLMPDGALGAITSRTGFFLVSFEKWRNRFLLPNRNPAVMADLGENVMDGAMVEASAYILRRRPSQEYGIFMRVLCESDRAATLASMTHAIFNREKDDRTFALDVFSLANLPGSPFAYWISSNVVERLSRLPLLIPEGAEVRQGLATADDHRFARAIWEVPPYLLWEANHPEKTWVPYIKGGSSQPFFSPVTLVVNWRNNAEDLWNNLNDRGQVRSNIWMLKDAIKKYFFRPGFSWTQRATRFIPYAVPAGCIPSASRYQAYPCDGNEYVVLGLTASNVASSILRFSGEKFKWPHFLVENLKGLPWPSIPEELRKKLVAVVQEEVKKRQRAYQNSEPFHEFVAPSAIFAAGADGVLSWNMGAILGDSVEMEVARAYGFNPGEYDAFTRDLREAIVAVNSVSDKDAGFDENSEPAGDPADVVIAEDERGKQEAMLSYVVGVAYGRWDICFATGQRQPPELPDPFDPLPVCPPGMLQGPDGLPAKPEDVPSNYPLRIDWDGILVDDPGHEDDIIRRVRDVLEVIWKDRGETIEQEACEILGVRELRDYFHKPGNGGFWMDHVKRYSKSRRRAPIYWYLRSAKGNYGLWLYYHRLDKDILFKALLNYVEPKIRLEEDHLKTLRGRKEAAGSSGREAKQIEKDMDRQDQLVSELHDFADKLRRAANLHLEPDLNDGVVLTIAPLFELVPWKVAKEYWEDLVAGKYEWSSIGKQMREKGLVKI